MLYTGTLAGCYGSLLYGRLVYPGMYGRHIPRDVQGGIYPGMYIGVPRGHIGYIHLPGYPGEGHIGGIYLPPALP